MVIQKNQQLIKLLIERITTFEKSEDLSLPAVVQEMNADGLTMDVKRLKRFIKYGHLKPLPQVTFLWMLIRYGLHIVISLKTVSNDMPANRTQANQFVTQDALD